jgi:NAD(P)-dependent dehydrogenase (short-subunit alcohol dehydrogenase family)
LQVRSTFVANGLSIYSKVAVWTISLTNIPSDVFDTPMTHGIFGLPGMEQVGADLTREHKLGRFGQPEEIASVASFLLSADASFVTGHAIAVDGGYIAGRDHGVTKLLGLTE